VAQGAAISPRGFPEEIEEIVAEGDRKTFLALRCGERGRSGLDESVMGWMTVLFPRWRLI